MQRNIGVSGHLDVMQGGIGVSGHSDVVQDDIGVSEDTDVTRDRKCSQSNRTEPGAGVRRFTPGRWI